VFDGLFYINIPLKSGFYTWIKLR